MLDNDLNSAKLVSIEIQAVTAKIDDLNNQILKLVAELALIKSKSKQYKELDSKLMQLVKDRDALLSKKKNLSGSLVKILRDLKENRVREKNPKKTKLDFGLIQGPRRKSSNSIKRY